MGARAIGTAGRRSAEEVRGTRAPLAGPRRLGSALGLAALACALAASSPAGAQGAAAPGAAAAGAAAPAAPAAAAPAPARASGAESPGAPAVPEARLAMPDAVRLARTRGFDVLVASALVRGAQGDVRAAGQLPNPVVAAGAGRTVDCTGGVCDGTPWGFYVAVSDQGLVEGLLSRKRALREVVAAHALDAARYTRADVERVLVAQTKTQYVQAAAALARLDFTRDVAATLAKAVEVNRARYPKVIDEGQLARVEQEALKADQEVERAAREYRQQQIELSLLTGATGPLPELAIDKSTLAFRVPDALASVDKAALVKMALENRPDRKIAAAREAQGDAAISLARRQRVPDVSLQVQYQQQGLGGLAPTPPMLTFGAALPLPLLYQQQGEIRRAEADREAASVGRQRLDAVVAADIESSWTAFNAARAIVRRYEASLLERAKRAREITQVQYTAGSATLTDLLDAQRSFVQANRDYYAELVSYWAAVFGLEQAVGRELVP